MDGKLETAFSLNGKRVWVAGDTGMVGRATVRRLQTEECEILTVPHARGRSYRDAWNDRPVAVKTREGQAELFLSIGPRSVGCLVQGQ